MTKKDNASERPSTSNLRASSSMLLPSSTWRMVQAAGLEFLPGDTFGFRAPTSPSFQLMTETPVVTCATGGLAAKVPFEYCVEVRAISFELCCRVHVRSCCGDICGDKRAIYSSSMPIGVAVWWFVTSGTRSTHEVRTIHRHHGY